MLNQEIKGASRSLIRMIILVNPPSHQLSEQKYMVFLFARAIIWFNNGTLKFTKYTRQTVKYLCNKLTCVVYRNIKYNSIAHRIENPLRRKREHIHIYIYIFIQGVPKKRLNSKWL